MLVILALGVLSRAGALVLNCLVRLVEDGEERAVLDTGHDGHGGVCPSWKGEENHSLACGQI